MSDGAQALDAGSGTAIRAATAADWPAIWSIFGEVTAAGDSFAYDADTPEAVAHHLWMEPPAVAFVAEVDARVAASYFLRPNQPGRGAHVANAGYMVATAARGKGLAAAMCRHSIEAARALGYLAMQFNCVVSTNVAAVRAWQRCGFAVIGTVPAGFRHAREGLVDALIMHRVL